MGRQSALTGLTKASSSNAPATFTSAPVPSSSTAVSSSSTSTKSSILKSSFSPSRYQLRLFASVIQTFESQQLRIHDTNNGRLRCQYAVKPNTTVTCLNWGQYHPLKSESSSRKRKSVSNQDVVVAYGTSDSEICMFSPAQGKLVGQLVGGHERGIRDFKFSLSQRNDAWSLGGDGKLVQWSLKTREAVRSIALPDPAVGVLSELSNNDPTILCASMTPFTINIDPKADVQIENLDSMKTSIHTILRSDHDRDGTNELFLTADDGRHIHVYDIQRKRLVRTLIAASEVLEADIFKGEEGHGAPWGEQLLSTTTKNGSVELFMRPFVQSASKNGELKSSRKNLTQKATAKVQLVDSDSGKSQIPIHASSLQGPDLLVVSINSGVEICFQKIRWQDEGTGELLFDGVKQVVRTRAASSLNTATSNGIKAPTKSQVDESKTVIVNGVLEGSSQAAAIELDDSDDDEAVQEQLSDDEAISVKSVSAENVDSDEDMLDATDPTLIMVPEEDKDEAQEAEEPSFADMLTTRHPGTIDIASSFAPTKTEVAAIHDGLLALPTGMSLGTVLTQALRTNDRNLLEACLHTTDQDIVRNTIQRLESPLAGILLGKIAERMASRPGRYGDLQLWIQTLCVAHGASISSLPEAKVKIKSLFKVLDQRAKTLPSLLLLSGKLSMLEAQLRLRRQLAAERANRQALGSGMVYLEGDGDNWSSDDDIDEDGNAKRKGKQAEKISLEDLVDEEGSDDGSDMPLTNGVNHSPASDSDEESDEEEEIKPRHGRLLDDIAEVEDEDSDDEDTDSDPDNDAEEDALDDDEEEEDSEMDDFIDDGPITQISDDGLLDDAEEEEEEDDDDERPKKPEKKRRKF